MKYRLIILLFCIGSTGNAQGNENYFKCDSSIFVPQELDFGDGSSDAFYIQFKNRPVSFSLKIANSDGVNVFETIDPNILWLGNVDEKSIIEGEYFWTMSYVYKQGEPEKYCNGKVMVFVDNPVHEEHCEEILVVPDILALNVGCSCYKFCPVFGCPPVEFKMKIINRWGNVLFETNDRNIGWNAMDKDKNAKQGEYFYVINYNYKKGDPMKEKVGFFTLSR